MKTLLLFTSLVLLTGCSDFIPMSAGEADAFKVCIDKGWVPYFKVTTSARVVKCTRK